MIACHHDTLAAHLILDVGGGRALRPGLFRLGRSQDAEGRAGLLRGQAREVLDAMVASMEPQETIFQSLRGFAEPLRTMIPCDGIGVYNGRALRGRGHRSTPADVDGRADPLPRCTKRVDRCFLDGQARRKVLPDAMRYVDKRQRDHRRAVFAFAPKDYVLLFRREVVQTVTWGGDPRTRRSTQESGAGRLSPRESFAAWKEQVEGRSLAWRRGELEMAETLRIALLDVILRRANLVDRERRAAQETQLLLVAELNHRVKNVLAVIRSLVRQSQQVATSFEGFTADLAVPHPRAGQGARPADPGALEAGPVAWARRCRGRSLDRAGRPAPGGPGAAGHGGGARLPDAGAGTARADDQRREIRRA